MAVSETYSPASTLENFDYLTTQLLEADPRRIYWFGDGHQFDGKLAVTLLGRHSLEAGAQQQLVDELSAAELLQITVDTPRGTGRGVTQTAPGNYTATIIGRKVQHSPALSIKVVHDSDGRFEDLITTVDARMPDLPEPVTIYWESRPTNRDPGLNGRGKMVGAGERLFLPLEATAAVNGLMRVILGSYPRRPA
jgi:hypothetical protein